MTDTTPPPTPFPLLPPDTSGSTVFALITNDLNRLGETVAVVAKVVQANAALMVSSLNDISATAYRGPGRG